MTKMLQLDPDLLLTVGDLSYADGWAEMWDAWIASSSEVRWAKVNVTQRLECSSFLASVL